MHLLFTIAALYLLPGALCSCVLAFAYARYVRRNVTRPWFRMDAAQLRTDAYAVAAGGLIWPRVVWWLITDWRGR